jgi:hypothetical protein
MTMNEHVYFIQRQIDLLCYRVDRLKPGPHREKLVHRLETRLVEYGLALAETVTLTCVDGSETEHW